MVYVVGGASWYVDAKVERKVGAWNQSKKFELELESCCFDVRCGLSLWCRALWCGCKGDRVGDDVEGMLTLMYVWVVFRDDVGQLARRSRLLTAL